MSLKEIFDNKDKLKLLPKNVVEGYVIELLLHVKRLESKNMSLQTEIKFYKRNLKKVKDLIDKVIKSSDNKDRVWKKEPINPFQKTL